jgi:hypothetical protein
VTLTARIVAFVEKHSGRTAWGIAKDLGESSASVSSILNRLSVQGKLLRSKSYSGSWVYRVG